MRDSVSPMPILVVIDGPAGAGKSSAARRLAQELGVPLLDTGAIYRTLALWAERRGVSWDDEAGLASLAQSLPIVFEPPPGPDQPVTVRCDGEDVSTAIRTPHMSQGASRVSAWPAVRAALLGIQRRLGARGCVAEGRDMGTVVFPEARDKFFLTASIEARARRRHAELVARDGQAPAIEVLRREIEERDHRDSTRAAAPLKQADDAVLIDSSGLTLDEVVGRVLAAVRANAGG